MKFTKIVPSTFGLFIGYHPGLLALIKSILKDFFQLFLYVNAKLAKTHILMNLSTLSTEIEYYQEIRNI